MLELHIKRLKNSAKELGFKIDLYAAKSKLKSIAKQFKKDKVYMVRLLLSKDGTIKVRSKIKPEIKSNLVTFSKYRTSSKDPFLNYKTTRRSLYNSELKRYRKKGFRDAIFLNDLGEVTEACVANVFIKEKRTFLTPPIYCGLLPGVFREYMLRSKKYKVREKILYKEDLLKAKEIYLANSVSGLFKVSFPAKGK